MVYDSGPISCHLLCAACGHCPAGKLYDLPGGTGDTLKSLRLIPVDEVKLTLAKMVLALAFSVLIYLLLFAFTFFMEAVLHLEALSIGLVLENMKRYLLDGIGAFFAILPITALVARIKKGYWLALVFAELFASMSS